MGRFLEEVSEKYALSNSEENGVVKQNIERLRKVKENLREIQKGQEEDKKTIETRQEIDKEMGKVFNLSELKQLITSGINSDNSKNAKSALTPHSVLPKKLPARNH